MEKLAWPIFGEGEDVWGMTQDEKELSSVEGAWADFAYGLRPDSQGRVIRAASRPSFRVGSLLTVHECLEDLRLQRDEGNRAAVFAALVMCAAENVPMPYWLADDVLTISRALAAPAPVGGRPATLHDLFGLERDLPTSKTRGIKARRDLQLRHALYRHVCKLRLDSPSMSLESSIAKARADLRFPYSQRKARDMFNEQSRIQSRAIAAWTGKKQHRL